MKPSQSSIAILLIAALLVPAKSEASLITYSGSGEVTRNSGAPDPWGIGDSKPFTFDFTLASDALDTDSGYDRARYDILSASASINGVSAAVIQTGNVEFIDNIFLYANIFAPSDEILTALELSLNGYAQTLTIVQYLAPSTFGFSNDFESLPVFSTHTQYDGPTISVDDYATFFPANLPFGTFSVPEPPAWAMLQLAAVLSLFITKRRFNQ